MEAQAKTVWAEQVLNPALFAIDSNPDQVDGAQGVTVQRELECLREERRTLAAAESRKPLRLPMVQQVIALGLAIVTLNGSRLLVATLTLIDAGGCGVGTAGRKRSASVRPGLLSDYHYSVNLSAMLTTGLDCCEQLPWHPAKEKSYPTANRPKTWPAVAVSKFAVSQAPHPRVSRPSMTLPGP